MQLTKDAQNTIAQALKNKYPDSALALQVADALLCDADYETFNRLNAEVVAQKCETFDVVEFGDRIEIEVKDKKNYKKFEAISNACAVGLFSNANTKVIMARRAFGSLGLDFDAQPRTEERPSAFPAVVGWEDYAKTTKHPTFSGWREFQRMNQATDDTIEAPRFNDLYI